VQGTSTRVTPRRRAHSTPPFNPHVTRRVMAPTPSPQPPETPSLELASSARASEPPRAARPRPAWRRTRSAGPPSAATSASTPTSWRRLTQPSTTAWTCCLCRSVVPRRVCWMTAWQLDRSMRRSVELWWFAPPGIVGRRMPLRRILHPGMLRLLPAPWIENSQLMLFLVTTSPSRCFLFFP